MSLTAEAPLSKTWRQIKLAECMTLVNGRAYSQEELLEAGTPVLRIQNLNGGKRWYYSDLNLPSNKYCESGDLLFAWSASFGPYIWQGPRSIYHYHIWKVLPHECLDKKFAFHLLQNMTSEVKSASHGISMLHMTKSGMEAWPITLPPLAEQRRIADILDRAEALRAKRRAALAQIDELSLAIFGEMFGDPTSNLKNWRIDCVASLLIGGPQNGIYKPSTLYGRGTPILRIDAFYNGVVTDLNSLKRVELSENECTLFGLQEDDVVINRVNSLEYLGKCTLIPKLTEPTVFESNMMRLKLDTSKVVPLFLTRVLQTKSVKQQILRSAKQAVNQASINQQDVLGFQVPVPPLPLQQEFACRVQAIDRLKAKHRQSLAEMDALFLSLQHRAFRGEL